MPIMLPNKLNWKGQIRIQLGNMIAKLMATYSMNNTNQTLDNFNRSNAEATFVQSTRMLKTLKTI